MTDFTAQEVELFEKSLTKAVAKGDHQARLSTSEFISKEMQRFYCYIMSYYPSGSFSKNPNWQFYRIAKNGVKLKPKFQTN